MSQTISSADVVGVMGALLVPAPEVSLPDLGRAEPSGLAVQALLEVAHGEGATLLDLLVGDKGPGELARALAEHFARYVRHHNQYLELSLEHRALLARLYESALADIRRIVRSQSSADVLVHRLGQLLARYYALLEATVRGLWLVRGIPEAFLESEPVCVEYSATFQLAVLGIHPADL